MLEQAQASSLLQEGVVLIGSESVGKSDLFRALTGEKSAIGRNVKESTIAALKASCQLHPDVHLTDLPGLQFDMDSQNTQLTLGHFQDEKNDFISCEGY